MLIHRFSTIHNWKSVLLLLYVQISVFCIHMTVDYPTPIAGLRLYSLSIQGGVIEAWILNCLSRIHTWNQPTIYAFASISFLLDIAFIPFLKTHSILFDGVSLIAGGVFLLSRYPWNSFPHAPRFLSSSKVCGITWSSLLGDLILLCVILTSFLIRFLMWLYLGFVTKISPIPSTIFASQNQIPIRMRGVRRRNRDYEMHV